MQFAGQRTDLALKPVGEPFNVLIKLTPDVLPEPDAVLVTGLTPQRTAAKGISEAEFLKIFYKEIVRPDTIFLGYNSVRFDDEFMRYLHYRNFYDAYEWQWKDNRSRWDLLDLVRLTRALRPEGIKWPFAPDGKPSNRLELLTAVNKLDHQDAHDALSDVRASIAVAKLIKAKQPKLFDFMLGLRGKRAVKPLVGSGEPFVYSSGKYPAEFEKTTLAVKLADHPSRDGALAYDLRHDPREFQEMSASELAERWRFTKEEGAPPRLPVKALMYNRCPAVAPLSVLDAASQQRLKLNIKTVNKNLGALRADASFASRVLEAQKLLEKQRQTELAPSEQDVDAQLYDGFFDEHDRSLLSKVQTAKPSQLPEIRELFHDARLRALLPLYKARNFPGELSDEERADWEKFCERRLLAGGENSRLARYFKRLEELGKTKPTRAQAYLLEELRLWGESLLP